MSHIREFFKDRLFSDESIDIMCASWRPSTIKQYEIYFKKWLDFCGRRQTNPLLFDEVLAVEFLTVLFQSGIGYSAINSARSAISTLLINNPGLSIGNSPAVKRFLKGVYEIRPPSPKYKVIWDVDIVLQFLKNFHPNEELPLSYLTYECVTLVALFSMQRVQTLQAIKVADIIFSENLVVVPIKSTLKQSNPRRNDFMLTLKSYPSDPAICVLSTLKAYVNRTKQIRTKSSLFISFQKPYLPVSKATISRWIKRVLEEAGIDVSFFTAHSTRAASSSAAKRDDLSIDEILKTAGWTNNVMFKKFYDKIIMES